MNMMYCIDCVLYIDHARRRATLARILTNNRSKYKHGLCASSIRVFYGNWKKNYLNLFLFE